MRWHDAELIALIGAVGLADLVVMGLLLRLVWRCGANRSPSSGAARHLFPSREKGRRARRGSGDCARECDARAMQAVEGWR